MRLSSLIAFKTIRFTQTIMFFIDRWYDTQHSKRLRCSGKHTVQVQTAVWPTRRKPSHNDYNKVYQTKSATWSAGSKNWNWNSKKQWHFCKSPRWSMLGLTRTRFPGCPCALCACCYSCGVIATTSTTSGERPSSSIGRVYKYYRFKIRFMRTIEFMAHGPMSQNLQGNGFVSTVNKSVALSNRKVRFLWCTGGESTQRIPIIMQVSSLIISRQGQPLRGLSYPMPWYLFSELSEIGFLVFHHPPVV